MFSQESHFCAFLEMQIHTAVSVWIRRELGGWQRGLAVLAVGLKHFTVFVQRKYFLI